MPVACGPDQHVADPHRARVLAGQRALVADAAAAVRRVVVDEQPVLQVLPGVGEVDAVQLGVAAGARVPDGRREPDQVAAEGHREVPQVRVPAERGDVVGDLDGVAGPVGEGDDGEVAAVGDVDLHVVGVGRGAGLVDDHRRPAVGLHVDDEVPGGRGSRPVARDADVGRRGGDRFLRHGDDGGADRGGERPGADPVHRQELEDRRCQPPPFGQVQLVDRDLGGGLDRDVDRAGEGRRPCAGRAAGSAG